MCHENFAVTAECKHRPLHGINLTLEPIRCKKFCKQALAAHSTQFGYCNSSMSDDGRKLKYHPDEEKWLRSYGSRHSCTEKRDRSGNLILERKLIQITGPCKKCIAPASTSVPKELDGPALVLADRNPQTIPPPDGSMTAQQPLQHANSSRTMSSDYSTMVSSSRYPHMFALDRGVYGESSTSRCEVFPEDSISNISTSRYRSEVSSSSYHTSPRDHVSSKISKRPGNDHDVSFSGSSRQSVHSKRDSHHSIDSHSSRHSRRSHSSSRHSPDEPKSSSTRHVHSSRTSSDMSAGSHRRRVSADPMRPVLRTSGGQNQALGESDLVSHIIGLHMRGRSDDRMRAKSSSKHSPN